MIRAELRTTCAAFDLGQIISARDAGGTRNRSFVVRTDRGKWLVRRRYEGYSDPSRVAFDHAAAAFLCAGGVPVVAPLEASDHKSYWRADEGLWEAYPFVESTHLRDGVGEDAIALAEALARWHKVGSSFPLRYDKLGRRGETDPEHLLAGIERVRVECPDATSSLAVFEEAVRRSAVELPAAMYSSLPHTLVHGDVQPANILMAEGHVSAFLDLDWCAWRPRVYDLCFALLCCCADHESPIGEGDVWALTQTPVLDPVLARGFMDVYQCASTPLSEGEVRALPSQLALSWCHIRVDNSLKVPADQRARFLERGGGMGALNVEEVLGRIHTRLIR